MTLVLRYAVRSDVGLLREGNEDSAYAGPRLLAVADGMGGHAAGEVASSLTIASMAKLDSEPPGGDMLDELSSAVAAANSRLQEMIIANPAVEGMGTTLTALFWSDGHATATCSAPMGCPVWSATRRCATPWPPSRTPRRSPASSSTSRCTAAAP